MKPAQFVALKNAAYAILAFAELSAQWVGAVQEKLANALVVADEAVSLLVHAASKKRTGRAMNRILNIQVPSQMEISLVT